MNMTSATCLFPDVISILRLSLMYDLELLAIFLLKVRRS